MKSGVRFKKLGEVRFKKLGEAPVSLRALIQRINRKLAVTGRGSEVLKATRGNRWRSDLGDYYLVDEYNNAIVGQHIDPESLGRELGVLQPWEKLVAEGGKP